MEDIKNIYALLLHSNGLKIKDIATSLNLDKYYVAEVLYSFDNSNYWQQDSSSLWYAKDGALEIADTHKSAIVSIDLNRIEPICIDKFYKQNMSLSLRIMLNATKKRFVLTDAKIRELLELINDGNEIAMDILVSNCQNLVFNIVYIYRNSGVPVEDLVQEGNIGLIKAIQKFNLNETIHFTNYAKFWILQSVLSTISKHLQMIHIPFNIESIHKKINREIDSFYQDYNFRPSAANISISNVDFSLIESVMKLPYCLSDVVIRGLDIDESFFSTDETDITLIKESVSYYIQNLLYRLGNRERDIVMSCFGIDRKMEESLCLIGERHNLTRERVRQIINNVLKDIQIFLKLRSPD